MEVAQIGRSIARALNLDEDLTEAIALAHDLGHTPFGHSGQDMLNACMRDYGGFEHNLQSLRVVDVLEEKYAAFPGLNLTFETREGILKHCSPKHAAELGELGQRFLEKHQPSLEAQIANLADEIAYNNHDVDDGLRSGLITIEQLQATRLFAEQYARVEKIYPDVAPRIRVHETVRGMINYWVVDLIDNSRRLLKESGVASIDEVRRAGQGLIAYSDAARPLSLELKQFLRHQLYAHYRVRRMTLKAGKIIEALFEAFMQDTRLLPPQYQDKIRQQDDGNTLSKARNIADYIAGMTDRYAIREHQRLFDPAELT